MNGDEVMIVSDENFRFVPYEMKTSVIKVTSYENREMVGVLLNPFFEQEVHFTGITQLIFLVEQLLDNLNFPQKGMQPRVFLRDGEREPSLPEQASEQDVGPILASFRLNVLFRQNASWQGSLVWMEEKMEAQFRSVLELIYLMDSVLTKNQEA